MSIELTEEQRQGLASGPQPCRVIDPATRETYVLVRADFYDRLQALYDDSPWTDEERNLMAVEAGEALGWDDMAEYEDYDRHKP